MKQRNINKKQQQQKKDKGNVKEKIAIKYLIVT